MENKNYENLFIPFNHTILDAIKKMDQIKRKLLIVVKDNKFYSLLSIGDIQRAIIKGIGFDNPIEKILRTKNKIKVATDNDDLATVKETMLRFRTEFMPVIDSQNNIVNVLFWDDIIGLKKTGLDEKIDLPVVIMAGGEGTRLKPLTNIIPKALVPLGEKPIIQMIIESFVEIGCNQFYISVNYKKEMIKQYFRNIKNRPYQVSYIEEQKPLGTAGSLYLLKKQINSTFFVSNCDVLIDQDYREVYKYHKENKNELTIVSALHHYEIPYGILETGNDGLLTRISEKPQITFQVNTGLYVLEPHLLEEVPPNEFFHITNLIENIKQRNGRVGVFPVSEKSWIDIGKWKAYQELFNKLG
ncbi:Nucleotidyl transferase [Caldithrix abyssi DSM 13497]|uniref:Nucleotidyl transferase n=1 Tax=Caldithrix abyssi DSM 13497 TaxID=880073 RepID=H1XRC2_CALAY|nr:nucleotidyltransferase family protein [Caldithrix abyssi]APF18392.1 Nucleotidyl transferase [Caldithrix abyssi DSM 13497]EHO42403.1 Nucleotidyl transferase [Caldithrix abyssi DSM 13497]